MQIYKYTNHGHVRKKGIFLLLIQVKKEWLFYLAQNKNNSTAQYIWFLYWRRRPLPLVRVYQFKDKNITCNFTSMQ